MKTSITTAVVATLLTGTAYAGGTHSHSHGDEMAIGMPGKAEHARTTIEIVMKETDDGQMLFEPATLDVKKGQTVRLKFTNKGELAHEFVMDERQAIMDHKVAMEKYPDMEHADPNAIHLEPGESGEIIWTFSKLGSFEFACLIPGHFEAGMTGKLTVGESTASN